MAVDTNGSDTVHTRYALKGTPTAMHVGQRMPSLELSHQGRRGQPGRSRLCDYLLTVRSDLSVPSGYCSLLDEF